MEELDEKEDESGTSCSSSAQQPQQPQQQPQQQQQWQQQRQQQRNSSSSRRTRSTRGKNSRSSGSSGGGSSRRKRASRRHRTARTRPAWICRCRFAGGRRFRPAKTRGYRAFPVPMAGGGFVWARGSGRNEGDLLVLDDDSARAFELALSLLRGGGNHGETQVCVYVCVRASLCAYSKFCVCKFTFSYHKRNKSIADVQ